MTANKSSVAKRGIDLLRDPQLNKSTAFSEADHEALGLTGLLPAAVDSEETQVQRALQQLGQKPTNPERYIYLIPLLDTDETLTAENVVLSSYTPQLLRRHGRRAVSRGVQCLSGRLKHWLRTIADGRSRRPGSPFGVEVLP